MVLLPFFAYLHSFVVKELLNPMNIASHKLHGEVILHCLSQLAVNKEMRVKVAKFGPPLRFESNYMSVVLQGPVVQKSVNQNYKDVDKDV